VDVAARVGVGSTVLVDVAARVGVGSTVLVDVAARVGVASREGVASVAVAEGSETDVLGSLPAVFGSVLTAAVVAPVGSVAVGASSVTAVAAPLAAGTAVTARAPASANVSPTIRTPRGSADPKRCSAASKFDAPNRQHPSLPAAGTGVDPPGSY
jgi:hypothetical protein